jgi:type IV pilus assembly protein PilA
VKPIKKTNQAAFSLIELLLVVTVILIISALAIPSLLRSKLAANEASAIAAMRTIATAEATYVSTYPGEGFANLSSLGGAAATCASGATSTSSCLLDDSLVSSGSKSGYNFTVTASGGLPSVTYLAVGVPTVIGTTGTRAFCVSQDSVIRFNMNGTTCGTSDGAL